MKKIILITLVAISSMAFAAESMMMKGTISSMDMKAKTMEVKAEDGTMMMFMVGKAKLKASDGKKAKMSMMKVGDMVEVSYDTKANKHRARSVMVLPMMNDTTAPAATPAK